MATTASCSNDVLYSFSRIDCTSSWNLRPTYGFSEFAFAIYILLGSRYCITFPVSFAYSISDLVLEPTYRYIILLDVAQWGGGIVLDDGIFLACESSLRHQTVARTNVSSAIAGGEGLFNLALSGQGVACLEAPCPQEELIQVDLQNDVLKIDGNMALCWSPSLQFTVERSGKTLIGSAASGEGLVNVYRGTGRVLMSPTVYTSFIAPAATNG